MLLHRSHEAGAIPTLEARAGSNSLTLSLSNAWLQDRPLLCSDLEHEREDIVGLAIELRLDP